MGKGMFSSALRAACLGSAAFAFSAAGAQSLPAPAADDAAAANHQGGIEEIVVTARKREESVQTVPVAVTAASGEALAERSIKAVDQLTDIVPNLRFQQAGANPGASFIGLRGQINAQVDPTADPPVSLSIDGLASPRAFGLQSALIDVDRIEVLRGPQGTLFGKNTTGGALSIFTKGPGDAFGGYVKAGYGNYDSYEATGAVDLPVAHDLAVRLVGSKGGHDGYAQSRLNGNDLADDSHYLLRGHIRFAPGDIFKFDLIGERYSARNAQVFSRLTTINTSFTAGLAAQAATALFGSNTAATRAAAAQTLLAQDGWPFDGARRSDTQTINKSRFENNSVVLNASADLGAVTVKSITGYRDYEQNIFFVLNPSGRGTPFTGNNYSEGNFASEELQILGTALDDKLNYVFGGYLSQEHAVPLVAPGTLSRIKNDSKAVFAQADYQLATGLRATAGIRYTDDYRYIRRVGNQPPLACNLAATVVDAPGICVSTGKHHYHGVGYLLSVDWQPTDGVLAYAKTSRAQKAGGENVTATFAGPATSYQPERVTDYEVGLKADFLDRRLRANLAGFLSDYRDIQRSIIVVSQDGTRTTTTIQNAARARIPGAEAEFTFKPVQQVTLTSSFGYIHPKYKKYLQAPTAANPTGDRSNEPWPSPHFTYSIGARVTQPTGLGEASLDVNWNGQSRFASCPTCADQANTTQGWYGLLNGTLGMDFSDIPLRVNLYGRNILDKKYLTFTIKLEDIANFGYNTGIIGAPRTFGVEATYRF